ncbi:MAG: hypothetical protein K2G42_05770, partial [Clostridia bacterium]|nr:hypothetical protein [Clostridia bacterium]
ISKMKNCKRLALFLILLLLIAIMSTLFIACDLAGEPYYGTYYSGYSDSSSSAAVTIGRDYVDFGGERYTYTYSSDTVTLSSGLQLKIVEDNQVIYIVGITDSRLNGNITTRNGYFSSTFFTMSNGSMESGYYFYSDGTFEIVKTQVPASITSGIYYLKDGVLSLINQCVSGVTGVSQQNVLHFWYIDKYYNMYPTAMVKDYKKFQTANQSNNSNSTNNGNTGGNDSSQEKTYTVTWKNYDGTVLKSDYVARGGKADYTGKTPTREPNDGYIYSFTGWSPSTEYSIYEDTTFTAQYDATLAVPNLPANTQPLLESAKTSFEGDGTEDSPYLIKTSAQLFGMGAYADKHFALANDIALPLNSQDRPNFTPLFSDEKPFNGTFDGRGYTIKNLYIYNTDTYYTGLFASVGESGVVKNLKLADVRIFGANYVGGIAGCLLAPLQIAKCRVISRMCLQIIIKYISAV